MFIITVSEPGFTFAFHDVLSHPNQIRTTAMFSFLRRPADPRPDPRELVRMAESGEAIVIDIREAGEVRATGKAACALHIPMATLRTKCDPSCNECAPELKNDKPVILYCASGGRASMAA